MDLERAVKWCVDHEATVYFNTSNPLEEDTLISFGKVQVSFKYPGRIPHSCGGNTLEIATQRALESWDEIHNQRIHEDAQKDAHL